MDLSEHLQPSPELALKPTALNNSLIMRIDPSRFAVATAFVAEGR